MTDRNDPKSIQDIERDIARERAELSDKIEHLRDEYSPERLIQSAGETLRREGAGLARAAGRTMRDHPVATTVTGLGLAALIVGATAAARKERGGASGSDDGYAGSRASLPDLHGDEGGPSVGERMKSRAAEMRAAIHEGTEELSEAARERVRAAREKAIEAQHKLEHQIRRGASEARDQAREHPLVAGALALAVGAAVGAALPRTRTEDATLGRTRDRLLDEADQVLREELRALREAGEAAVAEGREAAASVWERR